MKRQNNLICKISEFENLQLAFWKAQRAKQSKTEVIEYRKNLDENLKKLRQQILNNDLDIGNYHYFSIFDPKERIICATSFPQRVLQHAIMNVCHPIFENYQISDSYATRINKGTYKR